jgi:hypothetical protein
MRIEIKNVQKKEHRRGNFRKTHKSRNTFSNKKYAENSLR